MLETISLNMGTNWQAAALAAFLASLVEFTEGLTIILASGVTRGWASALSGAAAGISLLSLLVLAFYPLLQLLPFSLGWLKSGVGLLLIIFGYGWLHKAILRTAGILSLRDEAKLYQEELQRQQSTEALKEWDWVTFVTSFKAVLLEGSEVVFIIVTLGAARATYFAASIGAAAAMFLVILLGLILHKPLTRIPENSLKLAVGIILLAFGLFWVGEGMGFNWPWGEGTILILMSILAGIAFSFIRLMGKEWPSA